MTRKKLTMSCVMAASTALMAATVLGATEGDRSWVVWTGIPVLLLTGLGTALDMMWQEAPTPTK